MYIISVHIHTYVCDMLRGLIKVQSVQISPLFANFPFAIANLKCTRYIAVIKICQLIAE